ncbi:MAG: lysine--tRNA ligase [Candidatus Aenigmatarchaeota archaeon]|nr:MAG: lysine--tRNA ligase [Candidatus Aenigmarchaeota archaeon]
MHWADNFAKQVIERGAKEDYIVESGITPSGVVHIGNAREIMTQYFVYQSILKSGKSAKFLYIWDDFDRFRKVPKGVPEEFEKYLGMPLSAVPDPWGCHNSYAEHFESLIIQEMKQLNIEPVYLRAAELYGKGTFAENIKIALEKTEKIKELLNKFRKEPLADGWVPVGAYCEKCGKDFTKIEYLGGYKISYTCSCGNENEIDFREVTNVVNIKWRVDWPARWAYYGVDFESSGKDHKSKGGSWDTGVLISKEIFGYNPPVGPMYEFIHLKGQKEKMSSSKGNIATVSQLLEIYEPEVVRFIYAQRLNKTIFIPFDLDVYNIYNEFDKCERIYFGLEETDEDLKRKYELVRIKEYKTCPKRVSFSELVLLVQVVQKSELKNYISKMMKERGIEMDGIDLELAIERSKKVENWVEKYAPETVKIQLVDNKVEITEDQREGLKEIMELLKKNSSTDELQQQIFGIVKPKGKEFFQLIYQVLIGRKQGPRIAMLVDAIGRERVIERFKNL